MSRRVGLPPHADPVFVVDRVVHYGVANMPGAVPRTSTQALTNATLPYVVALAAQGWRRACVEDRALRSGVSIVEGAVTHPGVAESFGMELEPLDRALAGGPRV